MIPRTAISTLRELADKFPIVAVSGPRLAGKSTLCRTAFPEKPFISLDDPDNREFASSSPAGFLDRYPDGAILSEAHRSPELFSQLRNPTATFHRNGHYILTGHLPLDFLSGISRSPEGRFGVLRLLPLSISELTEAGALPADINELLQRGMFPPLYDRSSAPAGWYSAYVSSFLDREVRQHVNIRDLSLFQRLLRACATRTGQILNLSAMAKECGISHNTAKAWLSILEASHIVFFLRPHNRNFNKRLVKTPKLYFYDTGLVSWLLAIQDSSRIASHPLRPAMFETWVVSELLKGRFNRGLPANLYFWRDNIGNEIDLLAEQGASLIPIEISPEQTLTDPLFDGLRKWLALAGAEAGRGRLIYAGDERQRRDEAAVIPWQDLDGLAERL
jgi:predicted AAA+ superfamily ATPase